MRELNFFHPFLLFNNIYYFNNDKNYPYKAKRSGF